MCVCVQDIQSHIKRKCFWKTQILINVNISKTKYLNYDSEFFQNKVLPDRNPILKVTLSRNVSTL